MGKFYRAIKKLAEWFEAEQRVLPWRNDPSPYKVWISEIMLQQTQVATVVPYFDRFMKRFPNVKALATAPEEDVMLQWAGLGYYSRARNLHKAAKQIHAKRRFPKTREEWMELSGVGPYTAGAIASISLNHPEPILDGNVERVMSRVRIVADAGKGKRRLWRLARAFVEKASQNGVEPRVLNQALMELGAKICTPKKPQCGSCPVSKLCRANEGGVQESFPPKKPKKEWVHLKETRYLLQDSKGRILLEKSEGGNWRSGLWDLPASLPQNFKRGKKLGSVKSNHIVTKHKIERTTHWYRAKKSDPKLWKASEKSEDSELRWAKLDPTSRHGVVELPTGSAFRKTLKASITLFRNPNP